MRFSAALALSLSLFTLCACRHVGKSSNTLSDQDFAGNDPAPAAAVARFAPDSEDGKLYAILQTVAKNKPSRYSKAEVEDAAHKYLEDNGLIKKDEEGKMSAMFSTKWGITRIVDHGEVSAVLMNNHILQGDSFVENQQGAWQVIAMKKGASGGFEFMPFEKGFALPSSLKIALDNNPPDTKKRGLYYMEAKGRSLVDVMKTLYCGQPIVGLSAKLAPKENGKLDFDPTQGRNWQLVEPEFSLRRGLSAEIYDVFPDLLDSSYEQTAKGAAYAIAPWGAGAVRKILLAGKWTDVLPLELANKRRPGYEEE